MWLAALQSLPLDNSLARLRRQGWYQGTQPIQKFLLAELPGHEISR
jgi:hypothetical protein